MKRQGNSMTTTQKRRFDKNVVCPICNNPISIYEKVKLEIRKHGKCKEYIFYHERCLNEKEERKEKVTSD